MKAKEPKPKPAQTPMPKSIPTSQQLPTSQPTQLPTPRPTEQRGLVCPKCGCAQLRVVYTRPAWGGRLRRRRECRHCGHRITTTERAQ